MLSFLSFAAAEELRENETFVVYPGGEEHTFTKSLVSHLDAVFWFRFSKLL